MNNLEAKEEGEGPTICLFVEHGSQLVSHSLNVIRLPLHLSEHDHLIDAHGFIIPSDSKPNISVLTFPHTNNFLPHSASVNLGSKIYFLGGMTRHLGKHNPKRRRCCQVRVFDIDDPDQKLLSVAPMNAPKESPCVFVADGMIYALASPVLDLDSKYPSSCGSGFFERYLPNNNHWELLPDPPICRPWETALLLDRATVVGRRVFVGHPPFFHAIFNLDKLIWEEYQHPQLADPFPYGALFVPQSASLYHLCGPGIYKPGTNISGLRREFVDGPLLAAKRIPLTASKQGDYDCSLLKSPTSISAKEQIMAVATDLDDDKFFTDAPYSPWRDLFHVGGHFFCYVVTAPLVDQDHYTHCENNSRGIWIKFFEEVLAHTQNCNAGDYNNSNKNNNNSYNDNKTIFRPVASFCYRIDTAFYSLSSFIRCSVIGAVPDSWINAPLKKQQQSKLTSVSEEMDTITLDQSLVLTTEREKHEVEQTRHHELENTVNVDRETGYWDKLLAASEAQLSFLKADLARKNKRLKNYEALVSYGWRKEAWQDFSKAYALFDIGGENTLH